jgi:hypothetical protein
LHANTLVDPKLVLKNEAPLASPVEEHEAQFTDADEAGLVATVT